MLPLLLLKPFEVQGKVKAQKRRRDINSRWDNLPNCPTGVLVRDLRSGLYCDPQYNSYCSGAIVSPALIGAAPAASICLFRFGTVSIISLFTCSITEFNCAVNFRN